MRNDNKRKPGMAY